MSLHYRRYIVALSLRSRCDVTVNVVMPLLCLWLAANMDAQVCIALSRGKLRGISWVACRGLGSYKIDLHIRAVLFMK